MTTPRDRRSLLSDASGAIYVEFLVAFLPTFTFFVALLQLALLYATHVFVEHAATVTARTAALSLADTVADRGPVRPDGETTQRARSAALLTLAPLILDGSLNRVDVTLGDAAGASISPMTADHVDMVRARVDVDVRCKLPIGGRVVCGLGGGRGFSLRPSIAIAAESVFPAQLARARPAAGCEREGPGGGARR